MRRTIRLGLERLEAKEMLSGISAIAPGLVGSVSAVASRTLSGAQVVETYTETNVSNQDISVDYGPSDDGFTVIQGGKTIWNPSEGATPQFLQVEDLKPHQSVTIHGTWDVRANDLSPENPWAEGPPVSGTFTISNSMDGGRATATVTIPKSWTVPVKVGHVTPPSPPAMVHEMAAVAPRSS